MKCNSYNEFKKAEERYGDYLKFAEENNYPYISRFKSDDDEDIDRALSDFILYHYDMDTKEKLEEMLEMECKDDNNPTLNSIIHKVLSHLGEKYKSGILLGLDITEEDYYYIFKDNNNINYMTCVGKLEEY